MNTPIISRPKLIAEQVQEALIERIRQGIYLPEQRMPNEERLAEDFQVSRGTLRTALSALAAEGYVIRRQGDGTYVSPRAFQINLHRGRVWDIELQIKEGGREPHVLVLEMIRRPATTEEVEFLCLQIEQEVFSVKLLFCADQTPVMMLSNAIGTTLIDKEPSIEDITIPWLEFLDRFSIKKPIKGQIRFLALPAQPQIASYLNIQVETPVLMMSTVTYDHDDYPISLGNEYYIGQEGFVMNMRNG